MRTILFALASLACAQVPNVHVDQAGTGLYSAETILTPANVNTTKFGLQCTIPTLGALFGQVIIVANVTIGGVSHNIAVFADMKNWVYAADAANCGVLWQVNLGAPNTSYPDFTGANTVFYGSPLGCLATPLFFNSSVYVVCATSAQTYKIYKLDPTSGATSASATITMQVAGTGCATWGDTTSGGNVVFNPVNELARPGLKGASGFVYVTFGGEGDSKNGWHGWIVGIDQNTLAVSHAFLTTPNDCGGAIWGGEPVIDGSGNLYITTGNGGTYSVATSTYTDSILKLSSTLALLGSWTPSNQSTINADDADTAANRVIIIPGTNLLAAIGSKDFNVYVLDATCLGTGATGTTCQNQTFQTNASGTITSLSGSYSAVFMNNVLYLPLTAGDIYSFTWGGSTFTTTPLAHQANTYGFPGPAQMSGSCNGTSNCILWVVTAPGSTFTKASFGTLRALNPTTLAELGNWPLNAGMSKYISPVNYAGRVYVSTLSGVQVFGLLDCTGCSRGMAGNVIVSGNTVVQ